MPNRDYKVCKRCEALYMPITGNQKLCTECKEIVNKYKKVNPRGRANATK